MLRALAIAVFIGNALAHVAAFVLSWPSVQQVFSPPPSFSAPPGDWFGSPDRIIWLIWLVAVCTTTAFAVVGLFASGLGLAYSRPWWRSLAIVTALTSLVALLPWLGVLEGLTAYLLIALDVTIVFALAFPWGDNLVQKVQHK